MKIKCFQKVVIQYLCQHYQQWSKLNQEGSVLQQVCYDCFQTLESCCLIKIF